MVDTSVRAGGVGTAALELARTGGLRAYGTASAAKHDLVRELGGVPLDYSHEDWPRALREMEPGGVNAVFDAMGSVSMARSWKTLSARGTLIAYGFYPSLKGGTWPVIRGLLTMAGLKLTARGKKVRVLGAPAYAAAHPDWYRQSMEYFLGKAAAGQIRPVVHAVVPWRNSRDAEATIGGRASRGKVLLAFGT